MGAAEDLLEAPLKCLLSVVQHLGEGSACTRCRADEACMDMNALWDRYTLGTGEGWSLPVG